MSKWEYMELKITHGEVEVSEDEFRPPEETNQDPYAYVRKMIDDGWTLVTRSGSLGGEFSVVLKRPIQE
jgi:hypothetical protein